MSITTYYDTLGVSRKASDKEIKKQYHLLAKKYHPDVNPSCADLFKEILEAYTILSDKVKRKKYDAMIEKAEHSQVTTYNQPKQSTSSSEAAALGMSEAEYQKLMKTLNALNDTVCEGIEQLERQELMNKLNYLISGMDQMRIDQCLAEIKYMTDGGRVARRGRDNCSFETDMYYKNPHKESIFTILHYWSEYRFENAFGGIWRRNFLCIFGALVIYLLSLPFITINKVLFFLRPRREKSYGWHWVTHIHHLLHKNDLIATCFWSVFLAFMFVTKTCFTILYMIYWIFKNILRFFLLPIAIIIAAILRTFGRMLVVSPKMRF